MNNGTGADASIVETAQMLQRLLGDLASPNNEARSQAESHLNHDWVRAQPNSLISGLAYLVGNGEAATIRAFAS
ncbi:hypothetical protein EV182_002939, partial [Spiromyces aspiralis]